MNLLILSQHFYPERFQSNMLAEALLKKGYKITVLTAQPNYPEGKTYKGYKAYKLQKENWQGIRIYHVPLFPRGNARNFRLILNYVSYMLSSSFFSLFLKRKKFDACLCPQPDILLFLY